MYLILKTVGMDAEAVQQHEALTADFQKLYKELESEGYFKPSIPHVIYRLAEITIFALLGMYLVSLNHSALATAIGILSFGLFMGRR